LIAESNMMEWLRWHLEHNKALIVVAVLMGAALIAASLFDIPGRANSAGFGPDWECTSHPQGGPTCIKKLKP
jgi:hypothetical protein